MTTNPDTNYENTPAPEGHDEKMAKVFEDRHQAPAATPANDDPPAADRPTWLPEKFASAEDMAKAYGELEKKLGGGQKVDEEAPKGDLKINEKPPEATAEKALEGTGIKLEDLSAEYAKDGKLSEASYETLAKAGIPKATVDDYIAGQEAQAEVLRLSVFNEVGGEKTYGDMIAWAATNLTPGEIAAYNAATESGSLDQLKLAAAGLHAKFVNANGSDPKLLDAKPGAASADVYRSRAEMQADMRDPRYGTDPAFRKDVSDKLSRSNIM